MVTADGPASLPVTPGAEGVLTGLLQNPARKQPWKWGAVPLAWLMNGGSFALCVSKTGTTARQPSAGAGRERGVS